MKNHIEQSGCSRPALAMTLIACSLLCTARGAYKHSEILNNTVWGIPVYGYIVTLILSLLLGGMTWMLLTKENTKKLDAKENEPPRLPSKEENLWLALFGLINTIQTHPHSYDIFELSKIQEIIDVLDKNKPNSDVLPS